MPCRALAAATLVLALTACDRGVQGSPEAVAEDLASALEGGDFSGVPLVGGAAADAGARRAAAYQALGDAPLEVEVQDLERGPEEGQAEGRLRLTWDLPGAAPDLVREAPVRLQVVEDAWAATWDPALLGVPEGQVFAVEQLAAPRADIVDRDGEPLATARPVWHFGIDKTRVDAQEVEASALALAEAAGLDGTEYAASVVAAGPEAFVSLITYRRSDPAGQELVERIEPIPGAVAVEDEQVLGPTRTFGQPLLGTVGPVTAEMVAAEPERYEAGDVAGLSGLQSVFDEQLVGSPGVRVSTVDPAGGRQETVLDHEPAAAEPLRITLSTELQHAAERALADVGPASALVAIDHTTGDLLAVANGPGSEGASTALAGQYAPGSTFKLATALVLLRHGLTPESVVRCEPELVVDGYPFTNVPGYPAEALGDITLTTAMAHSCNTAIIAQRDTVPMAELSEAGRDLGMAQVWQMPVTAFSGAAPEEAATATEHAASLLGQGDVLASPTAMAVVAASIAEGRTVVPRVVVGQDVPDAEGSLSPQEAAHLRTMMRAVVTEGGGSILADNPGPPVVAKTGTAEFGTEDPPQTHVWMVASQGHLSVAVFIERGESGSITAGPIMDAFLTEVAGPQR